MPTLTDWKPDESAVDAPSLGDFDGFVAAATLVRNPRLARLYVYVCYYGPTTVPNVVDALDVARATAYEDVDQLESLGVLARDDSTRPHRLSVEPFAFVDDAEVAITPTALHAVALSVIDDDVDYFLNRYGVSRLVAALRVAGAHYAGDLTQRMAADELDVTAAEGMAVVAALRPALAAGRAYDPFFDRLLPEQAGELDLDVNVSEPTSGQSDDDANAE